VLQPLCRSDGTMPRYIVPLRRQTLPKTFERLNRLSWHACCHF
jgi:hypothetical protein